MLDLIRLHGRDRIAEHDYMLDVRSWTRFLKDYAFNEGKSVHQTQACGTRKKWVCTDASCPWMVVLSKRRNSVVGSATKLGDIPSSAWFVSEAIISHSDMCLANRACSKRQLQELDGFRSSIVPGLGCSAKRVRTAVKTVDGVNVDQQSSTVYRAIAERRAENKNSDPNAGYLLTINKLAKCFPASQSRFPSLLSIGPSGSILSLIYDCGFNLCISE